MADQEKYFINIHSFYRDSFLLAHQVLHSDFKPDFLVALWRGGTPVGIAVQEYFKYHQVEMDHIAIRTSSYSGVGHQSGNIAVHSLDYLVENLSAENRLLFVDDVFDTGLTLEAVLSVLRKRCRANFPKSHRIATLYFKPKNRKTSFEPDYFVHKTDQWLVFPHEFVGLAPEEIARYKDSSVARLFQKS